FIVWERFHHFLV
ncbi:putative membrane protein, partial [Vibrio parahaemolyticus EKP-021]